MDCPPKTQRMLSFFGNFGPWVHLEDEDKSKLIEILKEIKLETGTNSGIINSDDYLYGVFLPEVCVGGGYGFVSVCRCVCMRVDVGLCLCVGVFVWVWMWVCVCV